MESGSDPICSSAGCTQYKHAGRGLGYKINYPVANFGKDRDIVHSEQSATDAEKLLGHTFTPQWDEEDEKWIVPTESVEFKLAATAEDVNLRNPTQKLTSYDPEAADASCDARKKSSLISDLEWKKCNDKALRAQISYDPDAADASCDARRKSSLISDLEWKKCHDKALRAQLEKAKASNSTQNQTIIAAKKTDSKV